VYLPNSGQTHKINSQKNEKSSTVYDLIELLIIITRKGREKRKELPSLSGIDKKVMMQP